MKNNEQFNLIKELADMHNKAMDRHVISLVKIPPRKKKEDDKVVNK
jgi:hypothetical protein|tara:strand:- start:296 stop:433 length:138 start_codon:yes stop_codon:yes gene_type:complete